MKFLKKVSFYALATISYSINLSASATQLKRAEEMPRDPIAKIQHLEHRTKALQDELTECKITHKKDIQVLQAEIEELKEISKKHKDTILATISIFTAEMNVQRELNCRMQQSLATLTTLAGAPSAQKNSSKSTTSSEDL
jgi:hypothetical protein